MEKLFSMRELLRSDRNLWGFDNANHWSVQFLFLFHAFWDKHKLDATSFRVRVKLAVASWSPRGRYSRRRYQ